MSTSMHDTSSTDAQTTTTTTASGVVMEAADTWVRYSLPEGLAEESKARVMAATTGKLDALVAAALSDAVPPVEVRSRPSWADPARDDVDRRHNTHPDEQGVWFFATVDGWTVEEVQDGRVWTKKVLVELQGFRHDRATIANWPDSVRVDIEDPDGTGAQLNNPHDMRRLAAAVSKAAELLEGEVQS